MKYFEWTGKDGDTSPFGILSSGTGQSGTAVVDSTAGLIYSNAQSIKVTQQTSSGGGTVGARIYLPRPVVRQQVKLGMIFRVATDDAAWSRLYFNLHDYDGTNEADYFYQMYSNFGTTEEIQYQSSAPAFVDLGFDYPQDQGAGSAGWHLMEMDIDLTAQRYDMLRFDSQTSLGSKAATVFSSGEQPALRLEIAIVGTTTLETFYIDSVWVEEIE